MPSLVCRVVLLAVFLGPSSAEFALWRRKKFGTSVPDGAQTETKPLKNVIHFVVSGMRPEAHEAYGRSYMKTPTLDRLAKDSLTFERAYSQLASWSASRYSFMHGIRPDRDRLWTIQDNGDEAAAATNLPDFLKSKGYYVAVVNETTYESHVSSIGEECDGIHVVRGSRACLVDNMEEVHEYHVANDIIAKLQQVKNAENPFYFFGSIRQPRSTRNLHRSYWDLYPEESTINRAQYRNRHSAQADEWTTRGQAIPGQTFWPDKAMQADAHDKEMGEKRARKAYYVSVTQADAQIGRVLRAVEAFGLADKTLVVVHGDHGSQLGEHGFWEPALLEPSLRVPLMISAPWKPKSMGRSTQEFVELIDIRRTVPVLAGLEESAAHSDGHDLSVLLDVPTAETKPVAISQIIGCLANAPDERVKVLHVTGPSAAWRDCWRPDSGAIGKGTPPTLVMGYSLRVDGFRYVEWRKVDGALLVPDWTGNPLRTELYQMNDQNVNDFDAAGSVDLTLDEETKEQNMEVAERLHEMLEEHLPVEEQAHALDEFKKLSGDAAKPRPWDELLGTFFSGELADVNRISAGHEL